MCKVTLENVKGIKHLEFEIPTRNGVYLLTGSNGCGKTSLLAAISRLRNSHALADYFKSSQNSAIDELQAYRFTYTIDGLSVKYAHRNSNWAPTTKHSANILSKCPFPSIVFVSAANTRFYLQTPSGSITARTRRTAVPQMGQAMNYIFETGKFDTLKYVQMNTAARGRKKKYLRRSDKYYLLNDAAGKEYSERVFSFGERIVLNMLDEIDAIVENSLLLIDEIELALHPKAQIQLLDYLNDIAQQKHLIIILSTHSSSLIKRACNITYLENFNGSIKVNAGCKPSYILKDITIMDDNHYDYIFFVEDVMGKYCLDAILNVYLKQNPKQLSYCVNYVGGFKEVIRFMVQSYNIQPYSQRMLQSFLDQDAYVSYQQLCAKGNKTQSEMELLTLFNNNQDNISYLKITPEVGIWSWLLDHERQFVSQWRLKTNNNLFNLQTSLQQIENRVANQGTSNHAKTCMYELVKQLVNAPTYTNNRCYEEIVNIYTDCVVTQDNDVWNYYKGELGKVFNR